MFRYNDGYDGVYFDICCSDNPKNVTNGSTLRHYRNIWGISKKLCEYFGANKEQMRKIADLCSGYVDLTEYIGNMGELLEICYEEEERHLDAISKNEQLIEMLKIKRDNFCGVGTRKVKCFLNTKIKKGDELALLYRKVLECEDKNISAKDSFGKYQDRIYYQKSQLIEELISIAKEKGYIYGYQKSDVYGVSHVIFFEFPNMEQISWHNTLNNIDNIPHYNNEWDGKVNSTLDKVEDAISLIYGAEINKKYNKTLVK